MKTAMRALWKTVTSRCRARYYKFVLGRVIFWEKQKAKLELGFYWEVPKAKNSPENRYYRALEDR